MLIQRFYLCSSEVQSAEFLSYDRFCIYTCKSLEQQFSEKTLRVGLGVFMEELQGLESAGSFLECFDRCLEPK